MHNGSLVSYGFIVSLFTIKSHFSASGLLLNVLCPQTPILHVILPGFSSPIPLISLPAMNSAGNSNHAGPPVQHEEDILLFRRVMGFMHLIDAGTNSNHNVDAYISPSLSIGLQRPVMTESDEIQQDEDDEDDDDDNDFYDTIEDESEDEELHIEDDHSSDSEDVFFYYHEQQPPHEEHPAVQTTPAQILQETQQLSSHHSPRAQGTRISASEYDTIPEATNTSSLPTTTTDPNDAPASAPIPSQDQQQQQQQQQSINEPDKKDPLSCWEHGCNGRKFRTASNLRRHRKEKSRARPECPCPRCGAIFSRTTARNVHLERGSCNRIRRYSNGRVRPSRGGGKGT